MHVPLFFSQHQHLFVKVYLILVTLLVFWLQFLQELHILLITPRIAESEPVFLAVFGKLEWERDLRLLLLILSLYSVRIMKRIRNTHLNGSGVRCHSGVVVDLYTGRMPSLQSLCWISEIRMRVYWWKWYLVDKVFKCELDLSGLVLLIDDLEVKPRWISSFDRSPLTIGSYIELILRQLMMI